MDSQLARRPMNALSAGTASCTLCVAPSGFLGFIAACFVVARWFSARKQRGWAAFSRLTGVLFAAAFVGIASGSQQGGLISAVVIVAFTAAVVLGWAWLSFVQLQFHKEVAA